MPETVSLCDDPKVIRVDSYGDVTAVDLRRSLEEVARIHSETGINRVFVDATRETSLPETFPLFEFGSDLADDASVIRFAVAVSSRVKKRLLFLETVTRNRGMQVRMFDSADEALAWLSGKDTS